MALCALLAPTIAFSQPAQPALQDAFIDSLYFLEQSIPVDSLQKKSVLARFKPFAVSQKFNSDSWVSFRVTNPSQVPALLVLEVETTVYFDLIELYRKENGSFRLLGITGDPIHHSRRQLKDHALVFSLELPPASSGQYFMHATAPLEYQLPLSIKSLQSFERIRNYSVMFYMFYYGFVGFVLVLSIFLTVVFRTERIYLFYSLYILCLLFLFLHINGIGYTFLWPDWHFFDQHMPFSVASMSMIALIGFTIQFLGQGRLKNYETKLLRVFAWVFAASVVIAFFVFENQILKKTYLVVFLGSMMLLFLVTWVIAFRVYKAGFKPALFYLAAFLSFFASTTTYTLRGVISMNGWFSQHLVQFGNLLEIITLTLGLAYWFKTSQDEKQALMTRATQQQKEMAEEKERIRHNLHDSLGSRLSTITLSLVRAIKENDTQLLPAIHDLTEKAMNELRDSIWAMNKDAISLEELEQRINSLFWQYRKMNLPMELEMKMTGSISSLQLSPDVGGHLYRIIQEAVQNAIKHSGATKLEVSIVKGLNFLKVNIHDNGQGFQSTAEKRQDHFGLGNMQRRAEMIGAKFHIESAEGTGTSIGLKLPLD